MCIAITIFLLYCYTVGSICTKILEHIVYSGISKHLQRYDVLCNAQHEFHPCDTQLIITVNDFAECLNKGGQIMSLLLISAKLSGQREKLCYPCTFGCATRNSISPFIVPNVYK